jgi:hypothetical protein
MKISTCNVCPGLKKKDDVTRLINENKIDICCIQEAENALNFPSFIEVESNAF